MRVVFSDGILCEEDTLKRLVLLADEIAFLDRPSVMFGDGGDGSWGFVGVKSPLRGWDTSGLPVRISVHAPASGLGSKFFLKCVSADLANAEFIRIFREGLAADEKFSETFLARDAEYRPGGRGADIRAALIADSALASARLVGDVDGESMFRVDTHEHRVNTLRSLLADASVRVTSALVVAGENEFVPISENRWFCRLLAVRTAGLGYAGRMTQSSAELGLSIGRAVIPEEVLAKLDLETVWEYRRSASDVYTAWSIEVDRLAARIAELPPERAQTEIEKVIRTEIGPRLIEFTHEMESARDRLLGDLVKRVADWKVPAVIVAHSFGIPLTAALGAMAALTVPSLVDFFVKSRDIKRRNALTYLLGVRSLADSR